MLSPSKRACTISAERRHVTDKDTLTQHCGTAVVAHSDSTSDTNADSNGAEGVPGVKLDKSAVESVAAASPTRNVDGGGSRSESLASGDDVTLSSPMLPCITGTSPIPAPATPIGDASQRDPLLTLGLLHVAVSGDASQRSPLGATPHQAQGGLVHGRCKPTPVMRGDASVRSPAVNWRNNCGHTSISFPSGGGASWSAAAASVVATRAAAGSCPSPTACQRSNQVFPRESRGGSIQTKVVLETDALKRWLSGGSGSSTLSGERLADWLRVAAPETYED